MWNTRKIINKKNGAGVTGLTLYIYEYSSVSPYYTGSPLYTYSDAGAGAYIVDITNTIQGTLVIDRGTTKVIPDNFIGKVFEGDDSPLVP